jgi:hypothetical protein
MKASNQICNPTINGFKPFSNLKPNIRRQLKLNYTDIRQLLAFTWYYAHSCHLFHPDELMQNKISGMPTQSGTKICQAQTAFTQKGKTLNTIKKPNFIFQQPALGSPKFSMATLPDGSNRHYTLADSKTGVINS